MASMLEELAGTLGGGALSQLAGTLGADNEAVGKAVAAALPVLLGGLARNARQPEGAASLANALGNDHDGSILDSLGAVLGGNAWAQKQANRDGEGILAHVFGSARPQVERQVQRTSGLDPSLVAKLLPLLAPIVLGYLGKKLRGGDSSEVANSLEQERATVKQEDGVLGSLIDMLDGDNDNNGGGLMDMAGDLLKGQAGRMILGKLLAR